MDIQLYIPRQLGGLVHSIWEQQSDTPRHWRILPSGSVELIFNLGPSMDQVQGKRVGRGFNPTENFCFLSGLHTKPLTMSFPRFHVMGVQMAPLAVKALFGIPTSEVRDWAIKGEYLLRDIAELEDRLLAEGDFMTKAKWLESFLFSKMVAAHELKPALKLKGLVEQLSTNLGEDTPIKIEDYLGYSRSHTHRLFMEWFGLSGSRYLRLRQFLNVLEMLHQPTDRLVDVAYQNGYYDQAHFIRHFREFTDMTPGRYLKKKTAIIGQLPV